MNRPAAAAAVPAVQIPARQQASNPKESAMSSIGSSFVEFFRYHGFWAIGVRLFRRMNFISKAAVISAIFLLVVAQLAFIFVRAVNEGSRAARKELVGVAYATDLLSLFTGAQELRRQVTAADGQRTPQIAELLARMEAQLGKVEARRADGIELAKPLKFVRDGLAALQTAIGDRDEAYRLADELGSQLLRALGSVVDESGLAQDPDKDSFPLMQASTGETLNTVHQLGRMRDLGAKGISSGSLTPHERGVIYGSSLVTLRDIDITFSRFERVVQFNPGLTQALAFQDAYTPLNPFLRGVRKGVLAEAGPTGDATAFAAAGQAAMDSLTALTSRSYLALSSLLEARIESQRRSRDLQLGVIALGLLVAAYFFYCFYLVTRGGMREVTRHVDAMARRDLSTSPQPWGKDEAAELMRSISGMQGSMRELIGQVRGCAETIAGTSGKVSAGAEDLARRTEKAAGNLQQTAAAMEQIAITAKHSEGRTNESATLGQENFHAAGQGGEVVGKVVATMEDIQRSSKKIGEIIGVIDSIAFQTNILALNAAVEAARAGEQGRGFAVVASEVRALAQRSASAARDIKELIAASTTQTENGTRIVRSAGETMNQLVRNAHAISGLLAEVSTAAGEQTRGFSHVNEAVAQLDQDTQRNAALVEQTTAAAVSMKAQANELLATAARFKLAEDAALAA